MHICFNYSKVTRMRPCSHHKILKIWTKCMKHSFSDTGQNAVQDCGFWGEWGKWSEAYDILLVDIFQGASKGSKNPVEYNGLTKLSTHDGAQGGWGNCGTEDWTGRSSLHSISLSPFAEDIYEAKQSPKTRATAHVSWTLTEVTQCWKTCGT